MVEYGTYMYVDHYQPSTKLALASYVVDVY